MWAPNDAATTCGQINGLLQKSVLYTSAVPPITNPRLPAGYVGPAVLTVVDVAGQVTITPSWYMQGNTVEQVPGVLQIDTDAGTSHISDQTLYDWLYNNQWQDSFHEA